MLSGRALALALLGWSLVKVVFGYLRRRPPGLERFHDNYGADRLGEIEPEQRELLARFGGCVACGLCDEGEAERIRASAGAYPGLMQLALASSRSMPDFDAAMPGFAAVPPQVLRAAELRCPARVPFGELAGFVRAHAYHAPTARRRVLPP